MSREELLVALRRDLDDLDRYAREVTGERFERDRDVQNMVLFAVYRVQQDLVDLCNLLIVERGLEQAGSYRDGVRRLAEAGLLTTELSVAIEGWIGLRNLVAHAYRRLDLDTVFEAVRTERQCLRDFQQVVQVLLA
ncbi:MAG: DUF86 domain-containing protein [Pseudomonadota bacterium]